MTLPSRSMKGYKEFKDVHFSIADYCVFFGMLVISTGTGIYFGYFKKYRAEEVEQDDDPNRKKANFGSSEMHEYLLGSSKLKIFPVAMSLVASYISGVTMLGTPSEIYNYGTQYWLVIVPIVLMGITVAMVYLPVFSTLRVGSSYEYLELRFNGPVRSIVSFLFVMDEVLFLPFVVYVPAIALNQVTGINIYVVSVVVVVVCVFYTLIGGIKAVVHTDAWQILVMFLSLVVVVALGAWVAGGLGAVFDHADEGGRLIFFNMSPSMYERQTFMAVMIGGFSYWTSFNSVNQTMVQRYMSLPTLRAAQKSIAIFVVGIMLFLSLCCFSGLLVYDLYRNCDPLTAGLITHDDQLLPIYVMQTIGHLKGVPGLFIAGVFGAALSSLSVILNSTALVVLEDIVKGCFRLKLTHRATKNLVKGSILVLGVISLSLIFVLEKLSGILSVATSLTAIASGTTFGIFTLGMLVPCCNNTGAIVGALGGSMLSAWISFGIQAVTAAGHLQSKKMAVSVSECMPNTTIVAADHSMEDDVFPLYRLSYHWINPIGIVTTVVIGTLASLLTGPTKLNKLDADLISPVIHRFLPKECFQPKPADDQTRDQNAQTMSHLLEEQRK